MAGQGLCRQVLAVRCGHALLQAQPQITAQLAAAVCHFPGRGAGGLVAHDHALGFVQGGEVTRQRHIADAGPSRFQTLGGVQQGLLGAVAGLAPQGGAVQAHAQRRSRHGGRGLADQGLGPQSHIFDVARQQANGVERLG